MPGRLEFEFGFGGYFDKSSERRKQDTLRILLMGDFSGRTNCGVIETGATLGKRPIRLVDIDNFDHLLSNYAPSLTLPLGSEDALSVQIQFKDLEDFHPDALYQRLELFQSLRKLRNRLENPETFTQAAAELQHEEEPTVPNQSPPSEESEKSGNMFERLLGKASTGSQNQGGAQTSCMDDFIQKIVAPHIVPGVADEQSGYLASVDDSISSQMRNVLHHPDFQALESVWRSAYELISRLETDEGMKVYLLDVSAQELTADIAAAGDDLQNSGLYTVLVDQGVLTMGGEPWSVLAGDYSFTGSTEDTKLLAALGAIASQAGGPFLASADPQLLGCESLIETPSLEMRKPLDQDSANNWKALRSCSAAPWIGLLLPRLLQRLPYGAKTDEIESFQFEENPFSKAEHQTYLWGSSAYACAMLLGEAFQENGWAIMQPGDKLDIDDLPAYTYEGDNGKELLPCAETLLSERSGNAILERGLMPLLSYRNRNAVRVLRFQSIAEPARGLAGPWE